MLNPAAGAGACPVVVSPIAIEVHDAMLAVFGQTVRTNGQLLSGKVHIPPAQAKRFGDSGAAGARESEDIRQELPAFGQALGDGQQFLEFFSGNEWTFLLIHFERSQVFHRQGLQ
jgi:hypothetical protein